FGAASPASPGRPQCGKSSTPQPPRRVLRDMGVLGSVSAMDGAIAAYMDVFTAVPKTPISRSARPAPPPRAALLPRVADHAPPTRLLPARERIAPPRERVLAAA